MFPLEPLDPSPVTPKSPKHDRQSALNYGAHFPYRLLGCSEARDIRRNKIRLIETFTLCVTLQTYFQPNPRGETLQDAPAPFSRCKNIANCKQITRINIGDHPNHFRRYSRGASYFCQTAQIAGCATCAPKRGSFRDQRSGNRVKHFQ
jgi:hypothetical protein